MLFGCLGTSYISSFYFQFQNISFFWVFYFIFYLFCCRPLGSTNFYISSRQGFHFFSSLSVILLRLRPEGVWDLRQLSLNVKVLKQKRFLQVKVITRQRCCTHTLRLVLFRVACEGEDRTSMHWCRHLTFEVARERWWGAPRYVCIHCSTVGITHICPFLCQDRPLCLRRWFKKD